MASKLGESRSRYIGRRAGKLTVVAYDRERIMSGRPRHYVRCACECGGLITVQTRRLSGLYALTSCGCEDWEPLPIQQSFVIYLAGLVDGEGCISLSRTARGFVPSLSVGMTGEGLVSVWKDAGVGSIYHRKSQREGWKSTYVWKVGSSELRRLLPMIHPYLRFKKEQTALMMDYLRLSQHVARCDKEAMPGYMGRVMEIYNQMRALNRKGVSHR